MQNLYHLRYDLLCNNVQFVPTYLILTDLLNNAEYQLCNYTRQLNALLLELLIFLTLVLEFERVSCKYSAKSKLSCDGWYIAKVALKMTQQGASRFPDQSN